MVNAFRVIAAIVVGLATAMVLLIATELFSAIVHPFPEGFEGTMDELHQHVAKYPAWVLAVVIPIWGLTAFIGTWVTKYIGGRGPAIFVGLLLVGGVIYNVYLLSYLWWFEVVIVIVVLFAVATAVGRSAPVSANDDSGRWEDA